ncbi:hypothetical protein DL93DRAFT_2082142, partial [Clavulina sp. PMI_390]
MPVVSDQDLLSLITHAEEFIKEAKHAGFDLDEWKSKFGFGLEDGEIIDASSTSIAIPDSGAPVLEHPTPITENVAPKELAKTEAPDWSNQLPTVVRTLCVVAGTSIPSTAKLDFQLAKEERASVRRWSLRHNEL